MSPYTFIRAETLFPAYVISRFTYQHEVGGSKSGQIPAMVTETSAWLVLQVPSDDIRSAEVIHITNRPISRGTDIGSGATECMEAILKDFLGSDSEYRKEFLLPFIQRFFSHRVIYDRVLTIPTLAIADFIKDFSENLDS